MRPRLRDAVHPASSGSISTPLGKMALQDSGLLIFATMRGASSGQVVVAIRRLSKERSEPIRLDPCTGWPRPAHSASTMVSPTPTVPLHIDKLAQREET